LDQHPKFGDRIDAVSDYELEMVLPPTAGFPLVPLTQAHQVQCQQQGIYLTPDLYIVKLLVKATHSESAFCLLLLADSTSHRSAPLTAHMTLMTIWRLLLWLLGTQHSEVQLLSLFIGCRAEVEMLNSIMYRLRRECYCRKAAEPHRSKALIANAGLEVKCVFGKKH